MNEPAIVVSVFHTTCVPIGELSRGPRYSVDVIGGEVKCKLTTFFNGDVKRQCVSTVPFAILYHIFFLMYIKIIIKLK